MEGRSGADGEKIPKVIRTPADAVEALLVEYLHGRGTVAKGDSIHALLVRGAAESLETEIKARGSKELTTIELPPQPAATIINKALEGLPRSAAKQKVKISDTNLKDAFRSIRKLSSAGTKDKEWVLATVNVRLGQQIASVSLRLEETRTSTGRGVIVKFVVDSGESPAPTMERDIQPRFPATLPVPSVLPNFMPRAELRDEIIRALQRTPAVVELLGQPGAGKSELAVHVINEPEIAELYPDGIVFVDAVRLRDTAAMAKVMQACIGHFSGASPTQTNAALPLQYRSAIAGRRLLVVIDGATFTDPPSDLRPPMGVTLLFTSYVPTRLPGALQIEVNPFTLEEAEAFLAKHLSMFPACDSELRTQAAGDLELEFLYLRYAHSPRNTFQFVAMMFGRLPAALSLVISAMHRIEAEMARDEEEIDLWHRPFGVDVFSTLIERSIPHEHRLITITQLSGDDSLRRRFIDAYDTMSDGLQSAARRLSIFPDSFTPEIASAVCDVDAERLDELSRVSLLQRDSLTRIRQFHQKSAPFRLPTLFRSLCRERLRITGEEERLWRALAARFSPHVRSYVTKFADDQWEHEVFFALAAEAPTLQAFLMWADAEAERDDDPELAELAACSLVVVSCSYDEFLVRSEELLQYFRRAIARTPRLSDITASVVLKRARPHLFNRDPEEARNCASQLIAVLRQMNRPDRLREAIATLRRDGLLPVNARERADMLEERIALMGSRPDVDDYVHLASCYQLLDDAARAFVAADDAMKRALGCAGYEDQYLALLARADTARWFGDWSLARDAYGAALAMFDEAEDDLTKRSLLPMPTRRGYVLASLAAACARQGDLATAHQYLCDAIRDLRRCEPMQRQKATRVYIAIAHALIAVGRVRNARWFLVRAKHHDDEVRPRGSRYEHVEVHLLQAAAFTQLGLEQEASDASRNAEYLLARYGSPLSDRVSSIVRNLIPPAPKRPRTKGPTRRRR